MEAGLALLKEVRDLSECERRNLKSISIHTIYKYNIYIYVYIYDMYVYVFMRGGGGSGVQARILVVLWCALAPP